MADFSATQLLDPVKLLTESGIKQGDTVADFGCGTVGHFVFPAGKLVGAEGKVYAIDIQKAVVGAIEGRAKSDAANNVVALWGDIERDHGVRVPDATFHLSLLINNLFLTKQRDALARELKRTTKPGGTLLVIDWIQSSATIGPMVQDRISPAVAKELFSKYGFILDREFQAGAQHWGLVFKRAA